MNRSFAYFVAPVALALGAISLIFLAGLSAAQQGNESLGLGLFDSQESVNILPDRLTRLAGAARNARPSRGECPRGTITAFAPAGDKQFQSALAQVRRDMVRDALAKMGIDISQFYFQWKVADKAPITTDTRLELGAPRDETKPTLRVTWDPPKGAKVGPGKKITARGIAHDDANRWQTGIEGMDFIVPPRSNNQFFGFHQWPRPPQRCEDVPPPRTSDAVYTVPADPPPIIKLAVCTKDFVPLEQCELAEFPTGDFYGTLTRTGGVPPHQTEARGDFVLNHDRRGNLTGRMVGENWFLEASTAPGCRSKTTRPNRFRVSLVGSYTEGRALKVFVENIEETGMIINTRCPTYDIDVPAGLGFKSHVWFYQQAFLGTPSPLGEGVLLPDGTREYKWEGGANETIKVTLRRARN